MSSEYKPDVGLQSLKSFIETAKLDGGALVNPSNETKAVYKKFYSLLIYDFYLQKTLKCKTQKTYAREFTSDFSHGFFLTCIGLYKPARTSLRSGIENLIRFLTLHRGTDAMSLHSVYELFDEANKIYVCEDTQKKRISGLRSIYKELCKTVHSSSADYMNLAVPFNTMLKFDEEKFAGNCKIIRKSSQLAGELLFIEFDKLVREAHHTYKDILFDSVSKSVRKEIRVQQEKV